ncbi:MAG TPA: hypothetical protein VKY65_14220 [Alphaproteobacteria bacterium]|nr:hypothetical protein [Alphaproteobacteria bacterium]
MRSLRRELLRHDKHAWEAIAIGAAQCRRHAEAARAEAAAWEQESPRLALLRRQDAAAMKRLAARIEENE